MVNYPQISLDATFGALSSTVRRSILERLAAGEASVSELAKPHKVSLPAISKHLRVLEAAGLIEREKRGRVHYCRLNIDPMREAAEWLVVHQQFWTRQMDALETFLEEGEDDDEAQA